MLNLSKPLFAMDGSHLAKRCDDVLVARITVMGSSQCGKTSMIFRWLTGTYSTIAPGSYQEDVYSKRYKRELMIESCKHSSTAEDWSVYGGKGLTAASVKKRLVPTNVQFLDCEDSETGHNSELRSVQLQQSDAFVLCFDPTARESMDTMKWYYKKIEEAVERDNDPIIVICATKSDLDSEYQVTLEEVSEFLQMARLPASCFFEVSAMSGVNTTEMLCYTLERIEQKKILARSRNAPKPKNERCRRAPVALAPMLASSRIPDPPAHSPVKPFLEQVSRQKPSAASGCRRRPNGAVKTLGSLKGYSSRLGSISPLASLLGKRTGQSSL